MEAFGDVVIVNESVAGLFGVGILLLVARLRRTPVGVVPTHDADNVTVDLNPFTEVTLISATPLPPGVNVTEGVDVIEKSGEPLVVVLLVSLVVV